MWDDFAEVIFNAKEAKTIRKNVLLYHLKHKTSNKIVQCMKNLSQLKLSKSDLRDQISKLEEEYEQQEFKVKQKGICIIHKNITKYVYLTDISI